MIDLKIKDGTLLQYSEQEGKIYANNKLTNDWEAAFIPNGQDEPTFFGFIHKSTKKCYDIYGNISTISNEDSITL